MSGMLKVMTYYDPNPGDEVLAAELPCGKVVERLADVQ